MEIGALVPPNTTLSLKVTESDIPTRLDKYITSKLPLYSRSFFQQLINEQLVSVNGKTANKQGSLVKPCDIVNITFPPNRKVDPATISAAVAQKELNIEVIYEHEHFFIINKPANLLVHPASSKSTAITLVDWLLFMYPDLINVGHTDRPGIIHRLDKDTTGLMIIPRTPYALNVFGAQFKDRTIQKTYIAVVQGHPDQSGTINLPIGRNRNIRNKMTAFQPYYEGSEKKRDALTNYKVLEYFDDCTLVEVKPITGRTHQIRVHFAAIGNPLIGDSTYGKKSKNIQRQALHAHALVFTLNGEQFSFSKSIPDDMKKLLENKQKNK